VKINNQTTIASRRRFTKTASCRALAMRVLKSCLVLVDQRPVNGDTRSAARLLGARKSRRIHQILRLF
jgi:hypothetical protein